VARIIFGWPLFSDVGVTYTPALSGGSWLAALPLTNLQDSRLHRVARSTDDAAASTKFGIDLGVARAVRLLALVGHNFSSAATVRHRGFSAAPILDTLAVGDADWTASGTPTRSAAAFTDTDGIPLDLVGDDSGAAEEFYFRTIAFTGNGEKVVTFRVKEGIVVAAGGAELRINDTTAGVYRLRVGLTSSGGVVTAAIGGGLGSILSQGLVATGVYQVVAKTTAGLLAANTNRIEVSGASTTAEQGNVYLGDVMVWDADTDPLEYDTGYEPGWPSGIDAEESEGMTMAALHVLAVAQSARYWRTEINDTANPDTYVELGRLIIAGGWQPTYNLMDNPKLGLEDLSTLQETDGGATIPTERPVRRTLVGAIADLPEDEALPNVFDQQRILRTARQLFVVYDPDDTTHMHRRAFLARWRALSDLELKTVARVGVPISLIEVL
jgi:hypothetical protein